MNINTVLLVASLIFTSNICDADIAVSCLMVAPEKVLVRTAFSIYVPSTMASLLEVNWTNCSVSPGWKVTIRLVIAVKSANSEVWNRNYKSYRFCHAAKKITACNYLPQILVSVQKCYKRTKSLNYHPKFPLQLR